MTIEEAIAHAKEQTEIFSGTHGKFLDMAIAALEKQIPKKMNDIDEYEEDELCGYCPQCNKLQSNLWNENFCGDCGQAIDWGEGKMSMISEFVEKLRGRLKKELQLADEDKRKADVLQFDRAVGYANGMAIAIDILNQLAEEYKGAPDTNVGRWIPVSERLPGHYECVLACCNDEFVTIASFNFQEKRWECLTNMSSDTRFPEGEEVIAWQPLPQPYKGE